MDENNNDKTYMVLVIVTFLAFALAFGFAFVEWQELSDPEMVVQPNVFP